MVRQTKSSKGRAQRPKRKTASPKKRGARKSRRFSFREMVRRVSRLLKSWARTIWRLCWALGWRLAFVVALMIASATAYYYSSLPDAGSLVDDRESGSVTLFDMDSQVFSWRGEQFGGPVTVRDVSPHLVNAVLAVEDRRYFRHLGVSPRGIIGAMLINLREGRGALEGHGGSTITQQVGKLICFGVPYDPEQWQNKAEFERDCRRSTLWRKVKEIPFAFALELKYSKEQILMIYLNRAYLGAGATGFEAASQRYFGKPSAELMPSEAAMLAGLLKAPSRYAPTRSISQSRQRANLVVSLMRQQGYLTSAQAREAEANPAELFPAAARRTGGYFVDWVLDSGPSFLTHDTTEDVRIETTFDPRVQVAADDALTHIFETRVKPGSRAQAAIVVMSADGAVRAVVGGRDIRATGQFNRASGAKRQTGSLFKPIVYAAALEKGWRFDDEIVDEPISIDVPGSGTWSPRNYDDRYRGRINLAEALAQSVNTVAVKTSEQIGRSSVKDTARRLGVRSELASGPSIALGTSEASLMEMTAVFAGFLNGGVRVDPFGLKEIRLKEDDSLLMKGSGGMGDRAISSETARQMIYMLHKVVTDGTGRRAYINGLPVAGKTGTTQRARDAWFIGFSGEYVAGVWMGYDDNTPLTGVTGGGLPAEIWKETMIRIHEGVISAPLPLPSLADLKALSGTGRQLTGETTTEERRQNFLDTLIKSILGEPRQNR